jgi:hypothetical protein
VVRSLRYRRIAKIYVFGIRVFHQVVTQ